MIIADMHCDTVALMLEKKRIGDIHPLRENEGHVDLIRMKKSGYVLQNFALFVDIGRCDNPWEEVNELYNCYLEEMEKNSDLISPVRCFDDIEKNSLENKMSALLTVEEGATCMGETEKLDKLYDMGVRMMTLTWNYPNGIGFPNIDYSTDKKAKDMYVPNIENGLTLLGREIVEYMEKLGMIVDVSHLSDAGFYDVWECAKKPFVASHSNARMVCRNVRNLTDDMLRKLAERGGCTGLNFYPMFLKDVPCGVSNSSTAEAIVEHAKHIVNCAGIDVLALGSDFDGFDCQAELKGVQSIELLCDALHKGGFTQGQIDKIFYENVLRVYKEVLK